MASKESRNFFFLAPETGASRLDRFLGEQLREVAVSREKIKRAIKSGTCLVAGVICTDASRRLLPHEEIHLSLPTVSAQVIPEEGELEILYKDDALLVLNKPAGLTVHPAPSCTEGTLVHRLLARFPELKAMEGQRPGIVHRLDKDTSGLLCVALTEEARLKLAEAFACRTVHKEYLALVSGIPHSSEVTESDLCRAQKNRTEYGREEARSLVNERRSFAAPSAKAAPPLARGSISLPLGRHPSQKVKMAVVPGGKPASSDWRVLKIGRQKDFSLLSLQIHTGRTHQIRVHMAYIGHPLLGDALYAGQKEQTRLAPRQMLHAWKLSLAHPISGSEMHFVCPPPADFWQTIWALEDRMQRVVVTSVAGCGKSAFLQSLRKRALPAWSADEAVIRLYEPGQSGWECLRQRYGERFIRSERSPVDRKALAAALLPPNLRTNTVFLDQGDKDAPVSARELENMIHPLVFADLASFWKNCEQRGEPLAIAEVPLWFESDGLSGSDVKPVLIGIACAEEERRRRLLDVRGWSEALLQHMDSLQWDQARKMSACDLVIANEAGLEELESEANNVLLVLERLRAEATSVLQQEWLRIVQRNA